VRYLSINSSHSSCVRARAADGPSERGRTWCPRSVLVIWRSVLQSCVLHASTYASARRRASSGEEGEVMMRLRAESVNEDVFSGMRTDTDAVFIDLLDHATMQMEEQGKCEPARTFRRGRAALSSCPLTTTLFITRVPGLS
jgi:hypothetical protein